MEPIQLEPGWLARQMREVRLEVEKWPDVLNPLRSLNSALVYRDTLPEGAKDKALNRTAPTGEQK
ncbi:MAG: hypothetical protein WCK86_08590 [Planctomycetia bacterium]